MLANPTVPADAGPPAKVDTSPELRLTIRMVLAARRWRSLLDDRLRRIGHSAARMEAMAAIANAPPDTAQTDIARRIGIEGATLTRMLDSLESIGMVDRIAHPTDRRTKHLRLTRTGEAELARILAVAADLRGRLLGEVGGEDVDRASAFLLTLLRRMDDGLPDPEPEDGEALVFFAPPA